MSDVLGNAKIVKVVTERKAPYTPCFAAGSRIVTDRGAIAVEELCVGDRVLTRDHGYRPIRWIGAREFSDDQLDEYPELRPVHIAAGALDGTLPLADLSVSPQHRMLMRDDDALAGEREFLVPAIALTGQAGIAQATQGGVVYYHLMFDAHEVICSEGAWSESFLPSAAALGGMHSAQLAEILAIFPELAAAKGLAAYGGAARLCADLVPAPGLARAA
ncbi:MAG: Hint domain-containing protein [Albidovulum sp.]